MTTPAARFSTRIYNGRFYYIDTKMPLVELGETAWEDDGSRRSTTEIAAGEYVYPFSFAFPIKIAAPTFKGNANDELRNSRVWRKKLTGAAM